ncbi:MAG: DUF1700 domain-containing protein [Bacilli bacterium]|nr:DUF1700 domain-containing protein [Bacilli bacterium]
MKKAEFLDILRKELAGLPKDDLQSRMSFYEEAIADRMDEGKSEEEAIADLGSIDEIVKQIAEDTSLVKLVKEKTRPRRRLRVLEIILLILGFPLWFPLLMVGLVLLLVGYLLIWVLVLVTYTVEVSLSVAGIGSIICFFGYLTNGEMNLMSLGSGLSAIGAAILFVFACIWATKGTLKLSKAIVLSIKRSFMKKERSK